MKIKLLVFVLLPLLAACNGKRQQPQGDSRTIIEEAVQKGEVLKGEAVPIDTAATGKPAGTPICPSGGRSGAG